MLKVYKQLVLEVQRFFPEMVHKIYILNAPMFFDTIWEEELSQSVDPETQEKILISNAETHDDLVNEVD
jgi:hypothetical protein